MLSSDWLIQKMLRSDWLGPIVALITTNNNYSITILNNNNNNNNNNIYDNNGSNWPFPDVVRMEVYHE